MPQFKTTVLSMMIFILLFYFWFLLENQLSHKLCCHQFSLSLYNCNVMSGFKNVSFIVLLLKKIQSMLSSFSCFDLQQKAWVKLQWGESHLLSLKVCFKIFRNRICNAQLIKKKVLTQNQKTQGSTE